MADDITQKIKVTADTTDAQRGAKDMETSFTGSMIKSQLAVQAFNKALSVLGDQVKAGVEAVAEYDRTNRALEAALRGSGQEVEGNAAFLNKQAAELESVAGISDEVIRKTQALAINTGISTKDVDKFTRAAVSMSNTLGRDVNGSMEALIKLQTGIIDRNLKMIPGISDLTKEQLEAGEAIDLINDAWGENLDLLNQGITGKVNQLGVAWANFQENIVLAANSSNKLELALDGVVGVVNEMAAQAGEGNVLSSIGVAFDMVLGGGRAASFLAEQRRVIAESEKQRAEIKRRTEELLKERRVIQESGAFDFGAEAGGLDLGTIEGPSKREQERQKRQRQQGRERQRREEERAAKRLEKERERREKDLERSRQKRREEADRAAADFKEEQRKREEDLLIEHENRKIEIEEQAAQRRKEIQLDLMGQVASIAGGFINQMIGGLIELAEGSEVSFDAIAKSFLKSTGMQLISSGILRGFEGAARIAASYGTDPTGYSLVGTGAAMVAAGVPMLAGGLAIQTPSEEGGGGGGKGGGGGTPGAEAAPAGSVVSDQPHRPQQAIQANFFVVGEISEAQAITIRRGLQKQEALGFI